VSAAPIVYTIPEAIQAAKISRTRLYQEIGAGRLKIIKSGRRTLISEWALRAWLERLESQSEVDPSTVAAATAASVEKRFGATA
jgi:excisionase family DNA binding protein